MFSALGTLNTCKSGFSAPGCPFALYDSLDSKSQKILKRGTQKDPPPPLIRGDPNSRGCFYRQIDGVVSEGDMKELEGRRSRRRIQNFWQNAICRFEWIPQSIAAGDTLLFNPIKLKTASFPPPIAAMTFQFL
ncbi:hypothetical protein L596_008060 [Steinernema carpocapsae]|uniref:Uncharacterized protein n=1 Tax=Steinernema carpocapsae TaxID=34508 RepID=A0A4U5PBK6_STECR|nr:hypothetical protein L596_008060 [Steinernema carpocapsae]